jgi:hypothetical protein
VIATAPALPVKLVPAAIFRAARKGNLLKTESRLLLAMADMQRGKHAQIFAGSRSLARRTWHGEPGAMPAWWAVNVRRDLKRVIDHGWMVEKSPGGGWLDERVNGRPVLEARVYEPGPRLLEMIQQIARRYGSAAAKRARRAWGGMANALDALQRVEAGPELARNLFAGVLSGAPPTATDSNRQ